MDNHWFLIVRAPDGMHVFWCGPYDTSGPDADAAATALGALVETYKVELGVPADHVDNPDWDLSLSMGMPHPTLLARATLHHFPEA